MTSNSSNLALPYLMPSQAQKHVTHNEALQILDTVVQLAVQARDQNDPPASPAAGLRHIVGPAATGDWAGQEDNVALWTGNAWLFYAPQDGWRAWDLADESEVVWHSGAWHLASSAGNQDIVGINATADATNRLSVSAAATLLSHEGAGHQLKINKSTVTDTASLLFQNGLSGRAEMGLAGNDAFSVKVSEDGTSWKEALALDPATGQASGDAVQSTLDDTTLGRLMTVGAFGLGNSSIAIPTGDTNDIVDNGFYHADFADLNKPTNNVLISAVMRTVNIGAQLAFSRDSPNKGRLFNRAKDAGVWEDWHEIYTQHSVLGPVSQTAGKPTGAVIERGSNGNGRYVRFADGTQICTTELTGVNVTTPVSGMYQSSAHSWVFPASFINNAWSGGGRIKGSTTGIAVHLAGTGAISASGIVAYGTTSQSARTLSVHAVGRWF